jgi:hypothetical protein
MYSKTNKLKADRKLPVSALKTAINAAARGGIATMTTDMKTFCTRVVGTPA